MFELDRLFWEDKPTPISPIEGHRISLHLDPELYRRLLQVAFEQGTDVEGVILAVLHKEVKYVGS